MKIVGYLIAGLFSLLFAYGLTGFITGHDILTGVKYDEMAGLAPMLYMLVAIIVLLIELVVVFVIKKKKNQAK